MKYVALKLSEKCFKTDTEVNFVNNNNMLVQVLHLLWIISNNNFQNKFELTGETNSRFSIKPLPDTNLSELVEYITICPCRIKADLWLNLVEVQDIEETEENSIMNKFTQNAITENLLGNKFMQNGFHGKFTKNMFSMICTSILEHNKDKFTSGISKDFYSIFQLICAISNCTSAEVEDYITSINFAF